MLVALNVDRAITNSRMMAMAVAITMMKSAQSSHATIVQKLGIHKMIYRKEINMLCERCGLEPADRALYFEENENEQPKWYCEVCIKKIDCDHDYEQVQSDEWMWCFKCKKCGNSYCGDD